MVTASAALSAGTMTSQQTMHALVGTWSCITHDSSHKTWHETDVYSMWGAWLRDDTRFPAQNGEPGGTGISFTRYDSHAGKWVITGADTGGTLFTATSSNHAFDGSRWVDVYPADNGWANLHMPSSHEVVIDSGTPDGHGHTMTDHDVCTRT